MDNKELKRAELTCARVPNDVSEPCANENTENCERARQPSDRFCRPPAGATRDCAVSRVARLAQVLGRRYGLRAVTIRLEPKKTKAKNEPPR